MVGVWKSDDYIRIVTNNSLIDVLTIKDIAKTVKKIDKSNNSPCKIIMKPIGEMNFTWHGELFLERLLKKIEHSSPRVSISYENL